MSTIKKGKSDVKTLVMIIPQTDHFVTLTKAVVEWQTINIATLKKYLVTEKSGRNSIYIKENDIMNSIICGSNFHNHK